MSFIILLRGGGDIASGVALRLYRAGLRVAITELNQPLAVRRLVSFAEAVYNGETTIEGVTGRRVNDPTDTLRILRVFSQKQIPVLIDPEASAIRSLRPTVLIDGRMMKKPPEMGKEAASLVIGLGPGFIAGQNCHAVVETNRGYTMGRVFWQGAAEADTGIPESVRSYTSQRVLRAPVDGMMEERAALGALVEEGQPVAAVDGQVVLAPFQGVLRGLLHSGVSLAQGLKIGDVDPRADPRVAAMVSDKALAVGGGVLEAILSRPEFRKGLWE
ncbi:MAG: selenium-dependent molybdenum cofactor biosynthesis protein YqeB [Omnitrophica WOR_2 bacterium]